MHLKFQFCLDHTREFRFIVTSERKCFTLATPLGSVTQILDHFRNCAPITGKQQQLDLMLEAIESVSTESSQGDTFPRARFIDTQFTVDEKIVWEIGIVNADQRPLIVAIINRKQHDDESNSSQQRQFSKESQFNFAELKGQRVPYLTPKEFVKVFEDIGYLRSTDLLLEWSANGCDRIGLKELLKEGGLDQTRIENIVPPQQRCISLYRLSKAHIQRIIHFNSWTVEHVFKGLFPQHFLIKVHHEA
jgi:hypothetical protein